MAPFRFTLQQVLKFRTQLEDQAKMAYAKAQQAYDDQTRHIKALRSQLTTYEEQLYRTQHTSQADLWLYSNYVDALHLDIAAAENTLLQLAQELNRTRRELVTRSQEKKLLDTLKDKQAQQHAQEERFKEQLQFDETATVRYKPQTI